MKITESITITGVPGVERIEVTPDGKVLEHVRLAGTPEHPVQWGRSELFQYIEALTIALERAERIVNPAPTNTAEPMDGVMWRWRVDQKIDQAETLDLLPNGSVVTDHGREKWIKQAYAWYQASRGRDGRPRTPEYMINFAPLTLVKIGDGE